MLHAFVVSVISLIIAPERAETSAKLAIVAFVGLINTYQLRGKYGEY
jgi:hypothetical protein